ncbi:MAG: response regulator [Rhodopirellula sp.]|nr:response regulator [Rhodopirellula sp.]
MRKVPLGRPTPSRFGLKRQVSLAAVVLAVGLAGATLSAYCFQARLSDATRDLVAIHVPASTMAQRIALGAARCLVLESEFETAHLASPRSREKAERAWARAFDAMRETLREGETRDLQTTDRLPLTRWLALADLHRQEFLVAAREAKAGRSDSPSSIHEALEPSRSPLRSIVAEAERHANLEVEACRAGRFSLERLINDLRALIALRALFAFLALVAATVWFSRNVLRRIEVISAAAGRCAAGKLGTRVVSRSNDELGVLAHQFNEMASRLSIGPPPVQTGHTAARNRASSKPEEEKKPPMAASVKSWYDASGPQRPAELPSPSNQQALSGGRVEDSAFRILLAEDGPENQRLISFVLKRAGAEVTVVNDGQKALDAVLGRQSPLPSDDKNRFDVVFMDIDMPVMDGCEATRRLRQAGYGGLVIALTAHATRYDRDICLAAGFDDYVKKPIGRNTLLEIMSRHAVRPGLCAEAAGT